MAINVSAIVSEPLSLSLTHILRAAPAELVRVVNRSLFYGALTGGSFDVTVQPVIDLFRAHRNPSGELTLDDSELRAARALVGRRGLQVSGADLSFARSGMGITLDGIAKGYIADRVSAVLTSACLLYTSRCV